MLSNSQRTYTTIINRSENIPRTDTTIINVSDNSQRTDATTTDIDIINVIFYETPTRYDIDVIDISIRPPKVYNEKMRKKKPIFFNRHVTKNKYFLGYIRRKL